MKAIKPKFLPVSILYFILFITSTQSFGAESVNEVLADGERPEGIVFEIVSGDDDLLEDLLPVLRRDIKRLRQTFPDLPVAIVSHGSEQFLLTSKNRKDAPQTHSLIEQMTKKEHIDVHVCGTHAGWYGVSPEDFPDYVDVSTTGPAQINDYEELGYIVIVLP